MYQLLKGNPEEDFIEQNPEFEYIPCVQDLPKKDRSKILWSVYMMYHPDSSKSRIPEEERKTEIETTYFKPEWEELEEVKDRMLATTLSKSKLHFYRMDLAMTRMGKHLATLDPEEGDDATKMAVLMEKYTKAWTAFKKVEAEVEKEDQKNTLRGGGAMGARERRSR